MILSHKKFPVKILVSFLILTVFLGTLKSFYDVKAAIESNKITLDDTFQFLEYTHPLGVDEQMLHDIMDATGELATISYRETVFIDLPDSNHVSPVIAHRFETLSSNEIEVIAGNLPNKIGDVFIDEQLAKGFGWEIGDVISLSHTTLFETNTFNIVGIGHSKRYRSELKAVSEDQHLLADGFIYINSNIKENAQSNTVLISTDKPLLTSHALDNVETELTSSRFERLSKPQLDRLHVLLNDLNIEKQKQLEILAVEQEQLSIIQLSLQDSHSEIESSLGEIAESFSLTFGAQDLQTKLDTLKRVVADLKVSEVTDVEKILAEKSEQLTLIETEISDLQNQLDKTSDQLIISTLSQKILELESSLELLKVEILELQDTLALNVEAIGAYEHELNRIQSGIEEYTNQRSLFQKNQSDFWIRHDSTKAYYDSEIEKIEYQISILENQQKGSGSIQFGNALVIGHEGYMSQLVGYGNRLNTVIILMWLVVALILSYIFAYNNENRNSKSISNAQKIVYTIVFAVVTSLIGTLISYPIVPQIYKMLLISNDFVVVKRSFVQLLDTDFILKAVSVIIATLLIQKLITSVNTIKVSSFKKSQQFVLKGKFWQKLTVQSRLRIRVILKNFPKIFVLAAISLLLVVQLMIGLTQNVNLISKDNAGTFIQFNEAISTRHHDIDDAMKKDFLMVSIFNVQMDTEILTIMSVPDDETLTNWFDFKSTHSDHSNTLKQNEVVLSKTYATRNNLDVGSNIRLSIEGLKVEFTITSLVNNTSENILLVSRKTMEQALKKEVSPDIALLPNGENGNLQDFQILTRDKFMSDSTDSIKKFDVLALIKNIVLVLVFIIIQSHIIETLVNISQTNEQFYQRFNFGEKKVLTDVVIMYLWIFSFIVGFSILGFLLFSIL